MFSLDRRVSSLLTWDLNEMLFTFIGHPYTAINANILNVHMNESNLFLVKIRDKAENIIMNAII